MIWSHRARLPKVPDYVHGAQTLVAQLRGVRRPGVVSTREPVSHQLKCVRYSVRKPISLVGFGKNEHESGFDATCGKWTLDGDGVVGTKPHRSLPRIP